MRYILIALTAFLLAACGGGGGGSGSDPAPLPPANESAGVYLGSATLGDAVVPATVLLLRDDSWWVIYNDAANNNLVHLYARGNGTGSNGSYTTTGVGPSRNQGGGMFDRQFSLLTGNYVAGSSFRGTEGFAVTAVPLASISATYVAGSAASASLDTVAGSYTATARRSPTGFHAPENVPFGTTTLLISGGTFSFNDSTYPGNASQPAGTCPVTGSISPRPNENVYNVRLTNTCDPFPDTSSTGIAWFNPATRRLTMVGFTAGFTTYGFSLVGTKQ